jgi:hypothetical protein
MDKVPGLASSLCELALALLIQCRRAAAQLGR